MEIPKVTSKGWYWVVMNLLLIGSFVSGWLACYDTIKVKEIPNQEIETYREYVELYKNAQEQLKLDSILLDSLNIELEDNKFALETKKQQLDEYEEQFSNVILESITNHTISTKDSFFTNYPISKDNPFRSTNNNN